MFSQQISIELQKLSAPMRHENQPKLVGYMLFIGVVTLLISMLAK